MAFDVNSLPDYVEQRRLPLISKTVLGAKTMQYINVQTDVKHQAAINIVNSDLTLGDGSACGWSETGSTALSQRIITAGDFKINLSYCDKALLNKWAGYEVRVAAGEKRLPFEEEFTNEVIEKLAAQVDKVLWLGNTTPAATGILSELKAASAIATAPTADDAMSQAMQSNALAKIGTGDDVIAFCNHKFYNEYVVELIEKNLYHYSAGDGSDVVIPGTQIKLVPTVGLDFNTEGVVVIARKDNLFAGVDMVNDAEKFDLWYSKDNREFRLAIEFAVGGQVAFLDEVYACAVTR